MLLEVTRFHRRARALLAEPATGTAAAGHELTLGEFLAQEKFSSYFISHFMTPVVSAVWSCDPTTALAYPARYLFTFLGHHGLLGVKGSPQWRTVTGGSRSYVNKVAATLPDIRLTSPSPRCTGTPTASTSRPRSVPGPYARLLTPSSSPPTRRRPCACSPTPRRPRGPPLAACRIR
ncbi:hypothetical protein NicSoilC12_32440 [Arthrobacter sp. NicSoilC12]|nr:hypothetical protein NicSoilC12_32440 [Arthrobacter sp. NicSoilC12]